MKKFTEQYASRIMDHADLIAGTDLSALTSKRKKR